MDAPLPRSVPLAVITRSGVVDTIHRGSVVVVDDRGRVLLELGDRATRAYIRSAAKPIQAIPVLTSGAADAFRLTDDDVAIICGSHKGRRPQIEQVLGLLAKCGLTRDDLRSGSGIADNCSGKHAGMLAACCHQGLPLDSYLHPEHPHQQAILRILTQVCRIEPAEVHVGVDGCSAPIHHFPIEQMALGFARLSRPAAHFDGPTAAVISRITRAMWAAPAGHTGEPLYRKVLGPEPRLLVKIGGNGVYCCGIPGRGIGLAMKIDDGTSTPLRHVFVELLQRLGFVTGDEAAAVVRRLLPTVRNRRRHVVGEVRVVTPREAGSARPGL
jgi:L-asparaginase II